MSLKLGDLIEIKIDRLAMGGRGVGRLDGLVVFVSNVAPDEIVAARVTKIKKNLAEAELDKVIKASAHRVDPPCPYAFECGGCSWQQVQYEEQLAQKKSIVAESFKKFARNFKEVTIGDVIPSPEHFRYRNRIQLHWSEGKLGFFKKGSHEIVDIQDCLITDPQITKEFERLRSQLSEPKRVELYISKSGHVTQNSAGRYEDELGFSQVNSSQNQNLVNFVLEAARTLNEKYRFEGLLDLYAGSGNFTFPLADLLKNLPIDAVELHEASVKEGNRISQTDYATRSIRFHAKKVEDFLKKQSSLSGHLVVLDPPRTGADQEVIRKLESLAPQALIYISCHPVTLARDLSLLSKYKLASLQPFDMFPQTDHVETVVLLERT